VASVGGESEVVEVTSVWYWSITESRLVRNINFNVMLLQQLLPAIRHYKRVLHLSAGQCPGIQAAWGNQLFPHNFAKCWAILRIRSKHSSKFVMKCWSYVPPHLNQILKISQHQANLEATRMWANAQSDGRCAEYRWRPLFNAAKFGWRPLLECCAVMLPRCETHWKLPGCPKLTKRSQPLVGWSSPYCKDRWGRYCCLTSFSDCRYAP